MIYKFIWRVRRSNEKRRCRHRCSLSGWFDEKLPLYSTMKRFELLILRLSTPLTRWSFHHLASFFAHFGLTKYVKAACGEVPFLTLNEKKTKGGETHLAACCFDVFGQSKV